MKSVFFMQSHPKRFLFVCMDEFGLFHRQKQPAVVRAVHEMGCISLTFTGAAKERQVDRRASQK